MQFGSPLRWGDPGATLTIDMKNSPTGCNVSGWLDFNGDGDWDDSGEKILADQWVNAGNTFALTFAVPGIPPFAQGVVYARFRCSRRKGWARPVPHLTGRWKTTPRRSMDPLDWGDAPDRPYPTLAANNGAYHFLTPNGPVLGTLVDAEPDGQPDATATGDDASNLADEDGVAFATPLLPGQQAMRQRHAAAVRPACCSPGSTSITAASWGDGTGEQILAGVSVVPGLNAGLCFPVPATAQPGPTFARFRLTSAIAIAVAAGRSCARRRGGGLPGDRRGGEVEPTAGAESWVAVLLGVG